MLNQLLLHILQFASGIQANTTSPLASFWELLRPPEDISTNGYLIDSLFNHTTVLNIIYFLVVCAGLFGFTFFYFHRKHPKPYYTHGNKAVHLWITAAVGLTLFLTIDLNISHTSNHDMVNHFWKWPNPKVEEVERIEVLAQQWMWHFRYAGKSGEFNSHDDVVSSHKLVVPVDTKISFQITAKDVLHAFFIPNARLKVDAIPGRVTRLWVEFTKTGEYEIACAEMCGTHHYKMRATLVVMDKEKFKVWKESAYQIAVNTNDESYKDSFWGWKWEK